MKDQYKERQAEDQRVSLRYQSVEVEGQCTLKEISPIRFVAWRYFLFVISNVCLFIPWFMTFWYPHYERYFYYAFCSLEQATHFHVLNYDNQITIVAKQKRVFMIDEERSKVHTCFLNRYMTYVVDKEVVRVSMYDYRERLARIGQGKQRQRGLSEAQAHQLKNTYGTGTMILHRPSLMMLTIQQILRPLYVFIFSSTAYWIYLKYFYFAGIIFFFSVIGITVNLYQIRQQFEKIFLMAYYQVPVNVLRNGKVESISSLDVVPGDIVFLKEAIKIPFEGIILEGSALINECALTGQSAPVVKKADSFEKIANPSLAIDKNSFIYEGTTIVQANSKKKISKFQEFRQQYGLPVCVIRTNFVTTKGQLIRIILFPKEQENIFQVQAYKFILVVLIIIMTTTIVISLVIRQYALTLDLVYGFFSLVTIAVTPALPISMTFGIIYAIERLEQKKIFCIEQNKVIDGGITDFCCFDKTGTLTEEGMDFHTLVPYDGERFIAPIINNEHTIHQILKQPKKYPYINDALTNMAANNTIVKIEATGQLVGDPMEVKTFNFGNFSLNQSHPNPEVIFAFESERGHSGIVIKRFEFDSDLQRMSVVCQSSLDNKWKVYAKGSPQILLTIMKEQGIPKDYEAVLKKYASCGFRVLAIASRQISDVEAKVITRGEAENGLQFDGFQVFENKLKPETKGAISVLKNAQIGCVMITGDSTLTGSNISYKCGLSSEEKGMIVCDYNQGVFTEEVFQFYKDSTNQSEDRRVERNAGKSDLKESHYDYLDLNTTQMNINLPASIELITAEKYQESFMSIITSKARNTNSQLCVTGRAFNQLFPGVMTDLSQEEKRFMGCVTVFARTKPNEKARIVMAYQHMGLRVAMCGDGANDCGALKQADIGLSLSQAEASISAPFTSQIPNITAMVELIKECRTGLATNFSLFNIIAMYSFIQFTTTVLLLRFLQIPKDSQYLYWDLCLNFFFILVVGYTKTAKELTVEKPRGSLWSVTNLLQIFVAFLLQAGAQIAMIAIYCAADSDYFWANGGLDNGIANYNLNKRLTPGLQGNVLFLFTNNLYVVTMIAFNIAKPWREYFVTNLPLMAVILLTLVYNHLLILLGDSAWAEFHANDFVPNMRMRWIIFGSSVGFSALIYCVQKLMMEPISGWLIRAYPHKKWL